MWLTSDGARAFQPVGHWGYTADLKPLAPHGAAIAPLAAGEDAYLDLTDSDTLCAAEWRRLHPAGWIVVPLRHAGALVGVVVLLKPRAARKLGWEDRNLIEIVALQLGAFLVQDETARALADARQLEAFNKRFAFIIHDVKNTIGQLSLLTRNVEQFGHDAEFRKDMVATVREAVGRLQELLSRLKAETEGRNSGTSRPADAEPVDLVPLIREFSDSQQPLGRKVTLELQAPSLKARLADSETLLTVIDHIAGNAFDVIPPGRDIVIRLERRADQIAIAIKDTGPGMSAEFIAQELFRPLRSTKGTGFGIGAFQARELIRQLGGDIDVVSEIGVGTCFTLLLPASDSIKEELRS